VSAILEGGETIVEGPPPNCGDSIIPQNLAAALYVSSRGIVPENGILATGPRPFVKTMRPGRSVDSRRESLGPEPGLTRREL
jgi:hypothetical protein